MNVWVLVGLLDHPDSTVSVSFWCLACLCAQQMEIIKPESVIGKPNSQALCCRFSTAKLVLQVQRDPCRFCWPSMSAWPLTSPKGRAERRFRLGIYFPSGLESSHSRSSIPWIKRRGETDLQKGFSSSQVHIVVPHFDKHFRIWIWAQIQPSHLTKEPLTSLIPNPIILNAVVHAWGMV